MTYKSRPTYDEQQAMAAAMAGRVYPLIDATRAAVTGHTMGSPVENTSGMRIYRPPNCNTFNAEATAILFYRPGIATTSQSHYFFCIDRQGNTLGMICAADEQYGPIPIHPDVEYVSFFASVGTERLAGGWVVPGAHNSLTF